jgi:hypothetical protein
MNENDCCWSWHYLYDKTAYKQALKELYRADRPLFKKIIKHWQEDRDKRDCETCTYFWKNSEFPTEGYLCYLET